jgi:hypothetical protein
MDWISKDVVLEVFGFLSISELFGEVALVRRMFLEILKTEYLVRMLVQREYFLSFMPVMERSRGLDVLKKLFKRARELQFLGYATDGGIFNNQMNYSHFDLFYNPKACYCSEENKENINISAVLLNTFKNARSTNKHMKALAKHSNSFREITKFDEILHEIQKFEMMHEAEGSIRRFPLILENSENSSIFAAISGLWVSREGSLSCPVKTLMLFTSENYIDVKSSEFTAFNYLRTSNSVIKHSKTYEKSAQVLQYRIKKSCLYIEFKPIKTKSLKPILWMQMKEDRCKVKLQSVFTGRYFYAKLINAEDKRKDYDMQETINMNIDCSCILPYGQIIDLTTN